MYIHLVAAGTRMPAWVKAGFEDYARRLEPPWRLVLHEVQAVRRPPGADLARRLREEGARLLAAVPSGSHLVALDREGRSYTTEALAARFAALAAQGRSRLALLVGGPEGLSAECLDQAEERWSLSPLTFAHPLVRVVLAEQIYRVWSILNGRPYHR
jgi:23S rRNA (pseudouridine1915-N3)-methyltransferase